MSSIYSVAVLGPVANSLAAYSYYRELAREVKCWVGIECGESRGRGLFARVIPIEPL